MALEFGTTGESTRRMEKLRQNQKGKEGEVRGRYGTTTPEVAGDWSQKVDNDS